jgi:hypothetical protein
LICNGIENCETVSQFNFDGRWIQSRSADWQSATQQVGNLRYAHAAN